MLGKVLFFHNVFSTIMEEQQIDVSELKMLPERKDREQIPPLNKSIGSCMMLKM